MASTTGLTKMSAVVKAHGLRPDFLFSRAEDISLDWLRARGIRGVLIDIDNTITRWELQSVPDGELAWLGSHGTLRQLDAGEVLTSKGHTVEALYVVLSGRIAIFAAAATCAKT